MTTTPVTCICGASAPMQVCDEKTVRLPIGWASLTLAATGAAVDNAVLCPRCRDAVRSRLRALREFAPARGGVLETAPL